MLRSRLAQTTIITLGATQCAVKPSSKIVLDSVRF